MLNTSSLEHVRAQKIASCANWIGGLGYALSLFPFIASAISREDFNAVALPTFLGLSFAMTALLFVQTGSKKLWGGVLVLAGISIFISCLYTVSSNDMFSVEMLPALLILSLPYIVSGGLFILASKVSSCRENGQERSK